jgi:hypothetical protein
VSRALVHVAVECASTGAEGDALRKAAEMPPEHVAETDAKVALDQVTQAARAVERAVRAMVTAMLPSDEDRKQVAVMLDHHHFEEAVRRSRQMVEERKRQAEPLKGVAMSFAADDDGDVPAAVSEAATSAGLARRTRLPAPAARDATSILILSASAVEKASAQIGKQLESTRAARTLISAVIVSGLTWALYEHDFFGTGREIISLFALGFTTNLSADVLFAALDKVKKT